MTSFEHEIRLFGTQGSPLSADLYRPTPQDSNGWSVVICPGYGSIKELMTNWGRALAARGYHALVVGYRGYGETPGQVGRIFPTEHVDDVRSCIRWIRAEVAGAAQRLAVLGVSYGGAVALQAAAAEGAEAVISVVGYGSGRRHLQAIRRHSEWLALLSRVRADRAKRVMTGESEVITLNEILLRDEEAQQWREDVEQQYPGMRFDVTVESVDQLIEFEPERHLPFADGTGLLVIHAGNDSIIPREEPVSVIARADEPKRLVVLDSAEHHSVHRDEQFEACLNAIQSFLDELVETKPNT